MANNEVKKLQPDFDFSKITPDAIKSEMAQLTADPPRKTKANILKSLIEQIEPIDFAEKQYPNLPDEERKEKKVNRSEIRVLILDEILKVAQENNWALCKQG